jgi:hypothetical protein
MHECMQVGAGLSPSYPHAFKYKTLPLLDIEEQDLISYLPECFEFIAEGMAGEGGVLVHCFAGVSRSAAVITAFLMWSKHLSFTAARALVSDPDSALVSAQPNVCPPEWCPLPPCRRSSSSCLPSLPLAPSGQGSPPQSEPQPRLRPAAFDIRV